MASNISSRQNEISKGGARLRTVDVLVVLVGKPPSEALHLDWSPRSWGFLFPGDARAHAISRVEFCCHPGVATIDPPRRRAAELKRAATSRHFSRSTDKGDLTRPTSMIQTC